MTKRLLPKLLNRFDKKNRSAIINISSITGEYPQPYAAVYSGSKAFNDYFSICLSEEFKA
jgi:short-subunit dehydrogenase